jgi:ABC-type antimicrobial peptide transport system permease subunit
LLYGIEPYDWTVFLAVAAFACAIPAWRASRLDPLQALRDE